MWEIWANQLLPLALKSCFKSNKSPNLVTLKLDDFVVYVRMVKAYYWYCYVPIHTYLVFPSKCKLELRLL